MFTISKTICMLTLFATFIYAQSFSPEFTAGPDMNIARMGHYTVTFDDGGVLHVGGRGTGFTSLNTSDLFTTGPDTFVIDTMNYPHDFGAVARLNNGKILIAAGAANSGVAPGYNTAELYDPETETYTPTGALVYARMNVAAATLNNGKVLIVGGWYNVTSSAYGEIYDPEAGTFSATGALNTSRANPIVLPAEDGGAIIIGGSPTYGGNTIKQVEYYNPGLNTFTVLKDYLFSEQDPNWVPMNNDSYNRLMDVQKIDDNNYLLMAYDNSSADSTCYTLFTVNTDDKTITKFNTKNKLANSKTHSFYAPVVDRINNVVYLPAIKAGIDPTELDLFALNLSDSTVTMSDTTYTFPAAYYLTYSSFQLLNDGRILNSGGHSQTGYNTNFSPIPNTLFIEPKWESTVIRNNSRTAGNFMLIDNYPNPFNSSTTIQFSLAKNGLVTIDILNILGQLVKRLDMGEYTRGTHTLQWNAGSQPSGIYFCRLATTEGVKVRKLSLIK
ncbi:MAG: T9SS type A sorting domain-containing protein [Calditrichaceae bacterium]|nr:T9SS type A sorting domain-containing protein [Calditrichaceae bacterium]MBN2709764.1 T9SS type A sorting domain-containing protein [Calditrichaceae bacterium]RQV94958.1 MAG: T9SS C-terminal target domain-containing protein [Calditrichota bacterium]